MSNKKLRLATLVVASLWAYSTATTNSSIEQGLDSKAEVTEVRQKDLEEDIVEESDNTNEKSMALRIPHILECILSNLKCNDLYNAATVCRKWSIVATVMHKRLHSTKIIHFDLPSENDSCSAILKRYKKLVESGKDKERNEWRPQLMIGFLSYNNYFQCPDSQTEHLEFVRRNCKSFRGSHCSPPVCTLPQERSEIFFNGKCSGFIFPEALLAQPGVSVDVIFPTLEHLSNGSKLFKGKAEENKKMFQHLYGWKSENPIKCAIIMSMYIPNEPDQPRKIRGASQRAKEVIRWLKSLPEGGNMPICLTLGANVAEQLAYNEKIDASLSVILFGGSAVHVSSFMCDLSFPRNKDMDLFYTVVLSGVVKLSSDTKISRCQADDRKTKLPKVSQEISFLIGCNHYCETKNCYRHIRFQTALMEHHWEVCLLESTETDITLLDESRRNIYNHCYFKVGFE